MIQAIAGAQRAQEMVAVIMLGLDRFKNINDTLGHPASDQVLREVAQRLQSAVRKDLEKVIKKIKRALKPVTKIAGQTLTIDASMGIALYPQDDQGVEVLIKYADAAPYHAKTVNGRVCLRSPCS